VPYQGGLSQINRISYGSSSGNNGKDLGYSNGSSNYGNYTGGDSQHTTYVEGPANGKQFTTSYRVSGGNGTIPELASEKENGNSNNNSMGLEPIREPEDYGRDYYNLLRRYHCDKTKS